MAPSPRYNEKFRHHHLENPRLANEKLYSAEYQGSGTFIISKPKRKARKLRQSRVRNRRRGMRK